MKRIIFLLMSVIMCIALVSCGTANTTENANANEEIKTENANTSEEIKAENENVNVNINEENDGATNDIVEITPEEYDDIREGMTYEDVCNIIGGEPKETELALSIEGYILKLAEDTKNKKNSIGVGYEYDGFETDIDIWAVLYISALNDNDWEKYYQQMNDHFFYANASIQRYLFRALEGEMYEYRAVDKYTWQGQKINPNAKYRGYATISFEDGPVISKECKDLE